MTPQTATAVDGTKLDRVESYLEEQRHKRQGNKVLHGYPTPLLWQERSVPVAEALGAARRSWEAGSKRVIVYVAASPYCLPTEPDRCGFCLFPSEVYRNRAQLDRYLDHLEREGELFRELLAGVPVEAIYFGGGTSNLYPPDRYARLTGIVRDVLGAIPETAEVSLDGVPQLYSHDKLAAMKEAGIRRISVGVQQVSTELIALSGRKQTSEQVFGALESCRDLGLATSVDLIFGWPRQTVERMLADLEAMVEFGVEHITHYELNVAGRSAFARERADELPSRDENLEMYRQGKRLLEGAGYRQRTAYDWELDRGESRYRFEESWQRPLRSPGPEETDRGEVGGVEIGGVDMWGWGFAGVNGFLGTPEEPGWAWLNHPQVDDYYSSVAAGRFPVERGYRYDPESLRLNVLFQQLHSMQVDLAEHRRLFGRDLLEQHAELWLALERRGWARTAGERLELIGDGVFHTPLVQTALAADARGYFSS